MKRSLFESYGGFASVSKVVSAFYDKILDSDQLAGYFTDINMRRLIDHQTKFISAIMGGPTSISNEALARAHANLGITHEDFQEAVELLIETFEDFDYEEADIEHLRKVVLGTESLIVSSAPRPTGTG